MVWRSVDFIPLKFYGVPSCLALGVGALSAGARARFSAAPPRRPPGSGGTFSGGLPVCRHRTAFHPPPLSRSDPRRGETVAELRTNVRPYGFNEMFKAVKSTSHSMVRLQCLGEWNGNRIETGSFFTRRGF